MSSASGAASPKAPCHVCPVKDCGYSSSKKSSVTRHLASTHNIGVQWHTCPVVGCEYRAKQRSHMPSHMASIHNVGVQWRTCPVEFCGYKSKDKSSLSRHLFHVHNMVLPKTQARGQRAGKTAAVRQKRNEKPHLAQARMSKDEHLTAAPGATRPTSPLEALTAATMPAMTTTTHVVATSSGTVATRKQPQSALGALTSKYEVPTYAVGGHSSVERSPHAPPPSVSHAAPPMAYGGYAPHPYYSPPPVPMNVAYVPAGGVVNHFGGPPVMQYPNHQGVLMGAGTPTYPVYHPHHQPPPGWSPIPAS